MIEQWQELKETIIELRDSNGTGTQQEVCKFLANYMDILEKQMQQPCEDCVSKESVIEWLKDKDIIKTKNQEENARRELGELPSVTPSYNSIKTELKSCDNCTVIKKLSKKYYVEDAYGYTDEDIVNKVNEIIDAVNESSSTPQIEPSEDCISREEALLALTGMDLPTDRDKLIALFTERIQNLPPVTPQPKVGRWIEERDDYGELIHWHCSNCYEDSGFTTTCKWDYCPYCGAEMSGGEKK